MSLVGKTVAHFTIVGELGHGGMGIVYDAQDSRLPRRVALKFLPRHAVAFDDTVLARFRLEAASLSRLNHPHICTIYETGTYRRQPFIAMERLEGETLRQRLDRGTLPFSEILDFAQQLADALGAAHAQHIVHRDLKPGNVFITTRGVAKLLDFGLAKDTGTGPGESDSRPPETATGRPLGTAGCMSPEQICQRRVDGRSDLFSLGSLLYQMTCGRAPFHGESIVETIHNVLHEDPRPPSSWRPETPRGLDDVILKLLRKSPEDRYASAQDVIEALRQVRDRMSAAPVPESVAVLPFANAGGDPDDRFGEGLAEELIASLVPLPGLRVVSGGSASEVRAAEAIDIGRRLGVGSVLQGAFRRAGDRVRISARLVEVATGAHLWTETFDREWRDIFKMQEDIAGRIADAFQQRLRPSARRTLVRRRTPRSPQPAPQPANAGPTALDPSTGGVSEEAKSAPAPIGTADHQTRRALFGVAPPGDVWPEVKALAIAALATDPSRAAAHTSLGLALSQYDWDFTGAEREHREAIALSPRDARARYFYGLHLMTMGRLGAAEREVTMAIALAPQSKPMVSTLAHIYYYAGHHDAALRECHRAIALDARYFEAYSCLGMTEVARGNLAAGIDAFRQSDRLARGLFSRVRAFLAYALGQAGQESDARAVLDGLQTESQTRYVPPTHLAIAAIGVGEFERAFAALKDAFMGRDGTLLLLQLLPMFAPLHADRRFAHLCRRIGLPQPSEAEPS
jgi:TolB-like protein/Flp pilus assembly protein TadD